MRVLIAEDDLVSQRLLATSLRAAGHEVVTAQDGEQALRLLSAIDGPGLAILDWTMPGMSGVEVCRRVREDRQGRYRYLMLLTSNTEAEHAVEGIRAGADDFLRKPISLDELDARIRSGERVLALEAELVAAREEMRREATLDKLTGLLNRGAIVAALEGEVGRAQRSKTPLSVLILDLDLFKEINDGYGHDAGDKLLQETGKRIRAAVRGYDAVGRYGGEEFLVVLPGCDLPSALGTAERVRAAIADRPIDFHGAELRVTASIGVAELLPHHSSGTLVTAADRALYRAKKSGRNCVERRSQTRPPPPGRPKAPDDANNDDDKAVN